MDLNASAGRACSESIAISAIALDNYFHLLHPMKESEFDFACNGFRFSVGITGARACLTGGGVVPEPFRRAGFYFPVRLSEFMWGRVKKIYTTFLVAIVLWIAFALMFGGPSAIPTLAGHG